MEKLALTKLQISSGMCNANQRGARLHSFKTAYDRFDILSRLIDIQGMS